MKKMAVAMLCAALLAGCSTADHPAAAASASAGTSPAASAAAADTPAPVTAENVSVTGCAYILDANPGENYVALIIEGHSNAKESGFIPSNWHDFTEAMKDYIYDGPIDPILSDGRHCADPGNSESESVSMLTIRRSEDYAPVASVISSFDYQFMYKLADGTEGEILPAITSAK